MPLTIKVALPLFVLVCIFVTNIASLTMCGEYTISSTIPTNLDIIQIVLYNAWFL